LAAGAGLAAGAAPAPGVPEARVATAVAWGAAAVGTSVLLVQPASARVVTPTAAPAVPTIRRRVIRRRKALSQ
jgi:hypothetical protein